MTELENYKVIKKVIEGKMSKERAEAKLQKSRRQINRYIQGYKEIGKSYFQHGNRYHKPSTTIPKDIRQKIIQLYKNVYYDSNFTHFAELLLKYENIKVSMPTIKSILASENIISPKAHKTTKKKLKQAIKNNTLIEKEKTIFLDPIEAHPRRERAKYAGELIQMDASEHLWFGESKANLHAAIDDATETVVGLYFDFQETLNGYYNVLKQILIGYGIPVQFLTDKRTVFTYKRKDSKLSDSAYTQFGYACKQLGIQLDSTSVSQAKGRVERLFQTLQSRLIIELRIRNITTIEKANEFLPEFIKEFNAQFAINNNIKSVYEKQPTNEKINLILSRISIRKIDCGCCFSYKKQYYRPINEYGEYTNFRHGTQVMVIEAFDKTLYASINDVIYAIKEVKTHKDISENFEVIVQKPSKKVYIPPMNHPWRIAAWWSHIEYEKEKLKINENYTLV